MDKLSISKSEIDGIKDKISNRKKTKMSSATVIVALKRALNDFIRASKKVQIERRRWIGGYVAEHLLKTYRFLCLAYNDSDSKNKYKYLLNAREEYYMARNFLDLMEYPDGGLSEKSMSALTFTFAEIETNIIRWETSIEKKLGIENDDAKKLGLEPTESKKSEPTPMEMKTDAIRNKFTESSLDSEFTKKVYEETRKELADIFE